MLDNEAIFLKEIDTLKNKYKMTIPNDFITFLCECDENIFAGKIVNYRGHEAIFNNFILSKTDEIVDSMLKWYRWSFENREDYLTFAFGRGNDEFAIKVFGDNLGEIYHIFNRTEDELQINYMFKNWKEFVNQLMK